MADIPALAILLGNMMETISYNTDLIGRAMSNDLKGLCDDLAVLKASIKHYPEWQKDKGAIKNLENEIRDVVFEAENAIDTYILHASNQRHRGFLARAFHTTESASVLRSLGKRIAQVRAQVQNIQRSDLPSIGLDALQFDEISYMRTKKQTPLFGADKVIGFVDSAKDVIELLTGRSQRQSDQLEVISIVGMPGIGKTTLARKVLSDPMIDYEFFTKVFVHVSQDWERKDVFLSILTSFTRIDEAMNRMSDDALADEVRQRLKYKYLIVIDDLWSNDAWDKLKSAFPDNKKGSRVLITTRNVAVAHYANTKNEPYYLGFLSPEESRELLRYKVFDGNNCPEELQAYEAKILDRCAGLPLAIVVVAGILRNNSKATHWWMSVAENVHDYVAKNDELGNDVIRRSYNHLPYNLKPCFLYFGVFPEYFEIPAWKLIRLWISEGFIEHQRFMNMEDVAEFYLQELVDRSLVMIGQKRSDGRIKTCRMNNMLQDFCKKQAVEENIFREIKRFDESTSAPYSSSHNARRLCIHPHNLEHIKVKPTGDYVRSFLSFAKEQIQLPQEHISFIPKAFKLLKVLDIGSIIFSRFPAEFFYLLLLKYIAISCHFKVFPGKLSTLLNLQTIIIDTSLRALEIKADIWKMPQLRHLHTNCSTSIPKGNWAFVGD
ncbi:putative late blight resistance protein homolog R1B-16 isoform X2 [Coffea arabica]|uniref:Late blight resistance protein homolog R1B-16 isoform X2 n=1 Tax=Coffea arabica TaxID=13443 RepID=A0A6P6UYP7_COFAR|nr:putative late blight resistance protein homolog R1B-16 isoform X2 [Coffea arabica]XP_027098361.1 putative late blight resistance protein homolog R1B-16 isoform X2 [Coffea arabica]